MITLDSENSVIGAILISPETLDLIRGLVSPEDFRVEANRALFESACTLADSNETVDPVAMQQKAEECGSKISNAYLTELMAICPTANNAELYARTMAEAAARVRILELMQNGTEQLHAGAPCRDVCTQIGTEMEHVLERETAGSIMDGGQAVIGFMDYRAKLERGGAAAVSTGYKDLDDILSGGFVREGLYILAARPGIGKTTFALNLAERVAAKHGKVLFVSLEMSIEQLTAKRFAMETGIGSGQILTGALSDKEYAALATAIKKLTGRPMVFNRRPGASVPDIAFMARQAKDVSLLVVDYLGLIQHAPGKSIYERVTATSNALKRLARTLKAPVLCLAQLNREVEGRTSGKPRLSDLRDSGAIEQDADGVILLHRPSIGNGDNGVEFLDCIVAKNRHGAFGTVPFSFCTTNGRIYQVRSGHDGIPRDSAQIS